jgi:hypothetical protein
MWFWLVNEMTDFELYLFLNLAYPRLNTIALTHSQAGTRRWAVSTTVRPLYPVKPVYPLQRRLG